MSRPARARIAPHQLDRRRPRQQPVLGLPDLAHAAFAQLLDQSVAAHAAGLADVAAVAPDDPCRDDRHGGADVVGQNKVDERRRIDTGRGERDALRREHEQHERAHGSRGERGERHLARRGWHDDREDDDPGACPGNTVDRERAVVGPESEARPPEKVDLDTDGADDLIDQTEFKQAIGVHAPAHRQREHEQR